MLDEQNTHDEDDFEDTEGFEEDEDNSDDSDADDDSESTDSDDGLTPKETAEEVKARQKKAWLRKINNGEKTVDDMPSNLQWLKKEVEQELNPKKEDKGSVDEAVRIALQKKRDDDELTLLAEDMESVGDEKLAEFREEYESLRKDGLSALRATLIARKVVGLKDSETVVRERRRKGMLLPPSNSIARKAKRKDDMNDVERKFMNNLPPMYK